MLLSLKKLAVAAAVASAAALLPNAGAFAQNADTIRANCIAQAQKAFPDVVELGQNLHQREAVYATCMRSHGLTP